MGPTLDPGYNSNSSFLNWFQFSVPTLSCICQSSLSSLGAYRTAHSILCFADKPQDSANCSTSSKNGDKDAGLLSNFGAEWWFQLGILATGMAISGIREFDLSCDLLISSGDQKAEMSLKLGWDWVVSETDDSSESESSEVERLDEGRGYVCSGYGKFPKRQKSLFVLGVDGNWTVRSVVFV